jgi:hypothetical protein
MHLVVPGGTSSQLLELAVVKRVGLGQLTERFSDTATGLDTDAQVVEQLLVGLYTGEVRDLA